MSFLAEKIQAIIQITRFDKPIGTYLLLWPTYWALWIGSDGVPISLEFWVFTFGVLVMRSAGCVINDIADRKIDGSVKRTQQRPLVSGGMSVNGAVVLFISLILVALSLVMTLSLYTIELSLVAVVLAIIYPFSKRYTHLPQVVLGFAFSWGMIMAFAQSSGHIPLVAWLLFSANVCWTVAYDTMYAMVDRDDDAKIGVKSTAILFAQQDKRIIGLLQLATLALLLAVGEILAFGWPYQLSLIVAAGLFSYQQMLISNRNRDNCFKAFLNNHWVGLVVFCGIFIEHL